MSQKEKGNTKDVPTLRVVKQFRSSVTSTRNVCMVVVAVTFTYKQSTEKKPHKLLIVIVEMYCRMDRFQLDYASRQLPFLEMSFQWHLLPRSAIDCAWHLVNRFVMEYCF